MARDTARIDFICTELRSRGLDALVGALPENVLMLSGYWPVVGTSLAIVTADGTVGIVAPKDEMELAERGWADQLHTFQSGSLDELQPIAAAIVEPLKAIGKLCHCDVGRMGYEAGAANQPVSYAGMHLYRTALPAILAEAFPAAMLVAADAAFTRLRSIKSPREIDQIRAACRIAAEAYHIGTENLHLGLTECEAAIRFRGPLHTYRPDASIERADGFVSCMSGVNSAKAHGAFARSRMKPLVAGELALVHCNSYADGYWTDITRTFALGEPTDLQRMMYNAVLAARSAALDAIRPGARAADVDGAARHMLAKHGFGPQFKHPTGHGVGFAAIDHLAHPRLHPKSDETLEAGMVCNVEPAIYFEGQEGLRHCDLVVVTPSGMTLLTPFQATVSELIVSASR